MPRTILEVSILQTLPLNNVNRDDTGSPKTAHYGGVLRARVSSQAWKRATRLAFNAELDPAQVGVRSKRLVELIADRVASRDAALGEDTQRRNGLIADALATAKIKTTAPRNNKDAAGEAGYLVFLSGAQLDRVAEAVIEAAAADDPKASLAAAKLKDKIDTQHSVDIALFGRMIAESTDLNVDAAAQVAHALSVHAVATEYDYYTAVDDDKAADDAEDAGAGMIGTIEFNSSTLYRYATVDVDALARNLGGDVDVTARAVAVFLNAFITSMPTGKQNTFANRVLPDAFVISIRDTQPVNLVGAFEVPVTGERLRTAADRLAAHARAIDETFETTPVASWVIRTGDATASLDVLGERVTTLKSAVSAVRDTVAERLQP